jgi:antitoxin VapB
MARKTNKRATAKVFTTGRSQAVRIPKEYRFACDEVLIEREGERVILTPRPQSWRDYFARALRFSDDYPEHVADIPPQEREKL